MKMKSTPPLPAAVPSTARYVPRNKPRLNAKNTGNVRQRHSGSGGGEGACLVSAAVVGPEGCEVVRRRRRLLVALTIAHPRQRLAEVAGRRPRLHSDSRLRIPKGNNVAAAKEQHVARSPPVSHSPARRCLFHLRF